MIFKILFLSCCSVLLAMILASCAGQVAPGGGPVDAIPPIVIRTEPDTNATHIQTDRILIEFSEYVDRRSVEESIFLSPYLGKLELEWGGTEVTIIFTEKLRTNTTYVLNIGTDVVDIRAHNRMASGYTLAFSTGDVIDRGIISGRVFDEKPEGIMVFAYSLNGIQRDTLDPSRSRPDYIMQTGKDGGFTLSNMGWGSYRIFAVRDEYRNLIYDKQIDQFGVTTGDVTISESKPKAENVWFRLASEDTSKPFLTNVTPLNRRELRLRFSEPLDSVSLLNSIITIKDTATQQSVNILLRSREPEDSTSEIVITSSPLDSGKTYRLTIGKAFDLAGNPFDTSNSSSAFVGIATPDTVRPTLTVIGISDSTRGIGIMQRIEIRFSESVQRSGILNAIALRDSNKNKVAANVHWTSSGSVVFAPLEPLRSKSWYTIRVAMDSVKDFSENGYRDSVRVIRFQTIDLRTTGTIEGTAVDSASGNNSGEIFVTARRLTTTPPAENTIRLKKPGKFVFDQLPEGLYTVRAFEDRDSSQSYTFGQTFPFRAAERFAVFPDTIKVRARWGVQGIVLRFREAK